MHSVVLGWVEGIFMGARLGTTALSNPLIPLPPQPYNPAANGYVRFLLAFGSTAFRKSSSPTPFPFSLRWF